MVPGKTKGDVTEQAKFGGGQAVAFVVQLIPGTVAGRPEE
jgi:hypothetical protein